MKSRALKVLALFLVMGLGSGLLSIFVGSLSSAWMWLGLGAILLPGLLVSIIIAGRLGWLSLKKWSVLRCLSAALIIFAAYPISVFVMVGSLMLYEWLFSKFFPTEWSEHVYSGSYPFSIWALYVAAVVGAILVSAALRVLTKKLDKRAMLLMIVAGVVTIPLSELIAALIGERNWHLVLFPVGEALFGALSGYWLVRASPVQQQVVSSPATAREPHQRPA
ncbi:MAG: hypothetical protein H0U60_10925 [Blastocatellia bacterium]|nr:hypothetical protein [Blastocatellia bacterium]